MMMEEMGRTRSQFGLFFKMKSDRNVNGSAGLKRTHVTTTNDISTHTKTHTRTHHESGRALALVSADM